jgi:hypothetical protein
MTELHIVVKWLLLSLGIQRVSYSYLSRETSCPEFVLFDDHGSVHHNTNRIEITNKLRPGSGIYYSSVS